MFATGRSLTCKLPLIENSTQYQFREQLDHIMATMPLSLAQTFALRTPALPKRTPIERAAVFTTNKRPLYDPSFRATRAGWISFFARR